MYRFRRSYALNFMYGLFSGFIISWWSLPSSFEVNRDGDIFDSEEMAATFPDVIDVENFDQKIVRAQKMFRHIHGKLV